MKEINTYLMFNGNCRQAMTFYQKALGAELQLMTYGEAPADMPKDMSQDSKDRIIHARLSKGAAVLMASDTPPGKECPAGSNFSVSIACESKAEVDRFFATLGEKGKVTMPLQDTFWNAYFGMLTDQFGINWMFNFEKPRTN